MICCQMLAWILNILKENDPGMYKIFTACCLFHLTWGNFSSVHEHSLALGNRRRRVIKRLKSEKAGTEAQRPWESSPLQGASVSVLQTKNKSWHWSFLPLSSATSDLIVIFCNLDQYWQATSNYAWDFTDPPTSPCLEAGRRLGLSNLHLPWDEHLMMGILDSL
jgi:hypothetical protein